MGVVYCARDLRLDRLVALKILPPDQMANPHRRGRFEREAKTASSLNHPNIVTIHEIETIDGLDYIAMEWVRGSTLRELIPSGGMTLADVLNYANQIAAGLSAALPSESSPFHSSMAGTLDLPRISRSSSPPLPRMDRRQD